jgi:glycosyltransferase involved in cell wall biosynthesis
VIVPVRDERANVGLCVESLLRQHYPADRPRIIVIDNDSSDGTAELVESLASRDVSIRRAAPRSICCRWRLATSCTVSPSR